MLPPLTSGIYIVENARYRTWAVVKDGENRLDLISGTSADENAAHKWSVKAVSNGTYEIRNHTFQSYASCDPADGSSDSATVICATTGTPQHWYIKPRNDSYLIHDLNDRYWTVNENRRHTLVRLIEYVHDGRQAWKFIPENEDEVSSSEVHDSIAIVRPRIGNFEASQHAEKSNDRNIELSVRRSDTISRLPDATIDELPFVEGSAWDVTLACLEETRESVLDKVMSWVKSPTLVDTERIFLVADVIGVGKTALAHTVAERCSCEGFFVSSFFFDRRKGRTNPRAFLSTLARDVASRNQDVYNAIYLSLRADPSLALRSSSSQIFKKLVLEPVIRYGIDGTLVVVIDALDNADDGLLPVLRDGLPKLPDSIRFFVTTRPEPKILRHLSSYPPHNLCIHGPENLEDMALYVNHKLEEVASRPDVDNFPTPNLTRRLVEEAGGLFIWVSTLFDYLDDAVYPDRKLQYFLDRTRTSQLPPEKNIDALYKATLEKCPWNDNDFVEGYHQLMCTILSTKMPLSVTVLQHLHDGIRVKAILSPLGSVITGACQQRDTVQVLHQSFREFITLRAEGPYLIDAERRARHGSWLALSCLSIANKALAASITGCGYLSRRLAYLRGREWYAIKFWPDHVTNLVRPEKDVIEMLQQFLSQHLLTWIEVLVSQWRYRPLIDVRRWIKSTVSGDEGLSQAITHTKLIKPLQALVRRLETAGRSAEQAELQAEYKDIRRKLRERKGCNERCDSLPQCNLVNGDTSSREKPPKGGIDILGVGMVEEPQSVQLRARSSVEVRSSTTPSLSMVQDMGERAKNYRANRPRRRRGRWSGNRKTSG